MQSANPTTSSSIGNGGYDSCGNKKEDSVVVTVTAGAAAAADDNEEERGGASNNNNNANNRRISWANAGGSGGGGHKHNVINPLEEAAESFILSSIEDMEAKQHRNSNNKNNSNSINSKSRPDILEFVPHGSEGVFMDMAGTGSGAAASSAGAASALRARSASHDASLAPSVRSSNTNTSKNTKTNAALRARAAAAAAAAHRRTESSNSNTVEHDLFTLTNALQALQGIHHSPSTCFTATASASTEKRVEKTRKAGGSADLLAANAALLFRRKRANKTLQVNADGQVIHPNDHTAHATSSASNMVSIPSAIFNNNTAAATTTSPPTATTSASASAQQQPSAKSRWANLRTAVTATQGVKTSSTMDSKKTDGDDDATSPLTPHAAAAAVEHISLDMDMLDMDDDGHYVQEMNMNGDHDDPASASGDSSNNKMHHHHSGNKVQPGNNDTNNNSTTNKMMSSHKNNMIMAFLQQERTIMAAVTVVKEQKAPYFLLLCIIFLLLGVAFVLFHLLGNPPFGIIDLSKLTNSTTTSWIGTKGQTISDTDTSYSWWILFAIRQLLTYFLARCSEVLVIDLICLRLRWINVFRSPLLTLLFVQSRGWPFQVTTWAIYDFALLHGESEFVQHWLFYQDFLKLFNMSNPGGSFTTNDIYTEILLLSLCIGLITSCKRVAVGFMQGKRIFSIYGEEVASIMKKVLLISQVGILARDIEIKAMTANNNDHQANDEARAREDDIWNLVEEFVQPNADGAASDDDNASKGTTTALQDAVLDGKGRDELTGNFSQSQEMKIIELLGAWEDPEAESGMSEVEQDISVMTILQFRQSLAFLDARDMFGFHFGPTDTREHCIESSEEVYARLLYRSNRDGVLSFHVLAMLALNSDGTLKQEKIKKLIQIFRPQRDGSLSALDFVKSIDTVVRTFVRMQPGAWRLIFAYREQDGMEFASLIATHRCHDRIATQYKSMKLLRATIKKTQRLDQAVEQIFNVGFYIVVGAISLAIVGINPMALFLSLSSIVLAFAFMIGSASAKYFEGLLYILVQKPYGVGDKVYFNDPGIDCSPNGSAGWFVRDITLYHTTLVYGATNECCTVSNGSLAPLRVINAARSPKGTLYVYFKFGIEVPWSKIQVFETSLRAFVKSRPREWLGVRGFRTTRVEADLGFHEMVCVLQHRESWQNCGALLVSKAEVTAFCHELQKKMDMRYKSPPLPVDLTVNHGNPFAIVNDKDIGQSVVAKFEGTAAAIAATSGGDERQAHLDASAADFESVAKLFGKKD